MTTNLLRPDIATSGQQHHHLCLLRVGEPRLRNSTHSATSHPRRAALLRNKASLGTSICRVSSAPTSTFISLRNTFFRTVAPTSRKMRATVCSVGVARFFTLPLRGHDARWCPHEWSRVWQPSHRASVICSGRSSVLKCGGMVNSGLVGQCANATPPESFAVKPVCWTLTRRLHLRLWDTSCRPCAKHLPMRPSRQRVHNGLQTSTQAHPHRQRCNVSRMRCILWDLPQRAVSHRPSSCAKA